MPRPENPTPPEPEESPSNEQTTSDGFIRDADGDPIDRYGKKLPPELPDIPCQDCGQYTKCVQAGECLGPAKPTGGQKSQSQGGKIDRGRRSGGNKGLAPGASSDPRLTDIQPGTPYLPGGGGIRTMNANIDIGLTHLDEAVTPLTEATQHIQTALETTTNALHGTADRFALDALAAMAKAHARAERAAALIAEGVSNINSYREVVQRQAQRP